MVENSKSIKLFNNSLGQFTMPLTIDSMFLFDKYSIDYILLGNVTIEIASRGVNANGKLSNHVKFNSTFFQPYSIY